MMHNRNFFRAGIVVVGLVILFAPVLFYVSNRRENDAVSRIQVEQVLKNTWSQLEPAEQIEAIAGWSDGTVELIQANGITSDRYYVPEEYQGQQVYLVTFRSENYQITGNVEKLVDAVTGQIVGYNLRD